jgi:hypothetical protein
MRGHLRLQGFGRLRTPNLAISFVDSLPLRTMILWCIGGDDAAEEAQDDGVEHLHLGPKIRRERRLRYAGDGDMAAAATSLSRDLRSWSCGSGSIPIVDKMCSQR